VLTRVLTAKGTRETRTPVQWSGVAEPSTQRTLPCSGTPDLFFSKTERVQAASWCADVCRGSEVFASGLSFTKTMDVDEVVGYCATAVGQPARCDAIFERVFLPGVTIADGCATILAALKAQPGNDTCADCHAVRASSLVCQHAWP
jgi:hypothetical protein